MKITEFVFCAIANLSFRTTVLTDESVRSVWALTGSLPGSLVQSSEALITRPSPRLGQSGIRSDRSVFCSIALNRWNRRFWFLSDTRFSTQLIRGAEQRDPGAVSGSSRSLHGSQRHDGRGGPPIGRRGTRLLTEETPQAFGRRLAGESPCVRTATRYRASRKP